MLFLLVYQFQRQLLYHPSRPPRGHSVPAPAQDNLVKWESHGNFLGWRTSNQNAQASLLLFHGNAGHAGYMNSFLPGLQAATQGKVQAYLLEYPGYGLCPGEPSEATLIQTAQQGLSALPQNLPVYLMGQSLGCAVASALWAAAPTNRIRGSIMVVPFNNLQDTSQRHFPILPMGWLLKDRFSSDTRLAHDLGPLYVALAENDQVIPMDLGKKLYDGYPGRKKLMIKSGAGHNDLNHPSEQWWQEALGFIAPGLLKGEVRAD